MQLVFAFCFMFCNTLLFSVYALWFEEVFGIDLVELGYITVSFLEISFIFTSFCFYFYFLLQLFTTILF